jgi:uncharacterized surface protein with fasciclin (FAS1) repeats
MKTINKKIGILFLAALSGMVFLSSCNKDLEQAAAITPESGISVGQAIATNPEWSIFNAALIRTGIAASLNDTASNFTVFVPNDAAMSLSGISLAAVAALPIANLTALVQYHIVGSKVPSALFSVPFPNLRLPTTMALDPNNALLRMSIFPSKLTAFSYVNATQINTVDQVYNNGVIHNIATALSPTTRFLKAAIAADTALVYFRAAIARGDVGSTNLSRLDSLLNYAPLNMTVLTPNNAALRTLLRGIIYQNAYTNIYNLIYSTAINGGATPAQATAVADAQAPVQTLAFATLKSSVDSLNSPTAGFNLLPVVNVRGIVAYHFLATFVPGTPATPTAPAVPDSYQPNIRVFSVNIPTAPTFVKTLVNGSVSFHPGVEATATFLGALNTGVTFRGYTPTAGGPVATGPAANVLVKDNHNINGVYHIIDKVLLPQ